MAINSTPNIHNIVICSNLFVKKDGTYLVIRRSPQKVDLANMVHAIGGKIEPSEDPLFAAKRELMEEAGIEAKNIKLEGVVTEVPHPDDPKYKESWLIFYFSGEYDGGVVKETEEGELVWMTPEQLQEAPMFPSLKMVIGHITNPNQGPVFARFEYDLKMQITTQQITLT